ncbi:hypothetical protein [Bacteroides sp.]|uniref:hypothetical protein n=1 Tax=Bacteroides sp. TaxID=29523 RepID=UPI002FCA70E5
MKKQMNLLKLLFGAAIVLFTTACSHDDEHDGGMFANLPTAVSEAFNKQFPNATNVKWAEKSNYYVASFDLSGQNRTTTPQSSDNEAWYTAKGVCSLSELELSQAQLEKEYNAVFTAWKTTPYFAEGYHIDDIDLLQRNNGLADQTIKVEIEKGEWERDLYFTLDGVLAKDIVSSDDDENLPCPQALTDYINKHYKNAVIVDFEQETTAKVYEVEILFSQDGIIIEKELTFNEQYDFVGALIDIDDALLIKYVHRILTTEQLAEIAKLTGENNPSEWDMELREDSKGEVSLWIENTSEQMIKFITLDPNTSPA